MNREQKTRKQQGERLKLARIGADYRSARAAALDNDWPESSYRAHESGTRTIGQDDAERYARRFKVTAQYILFGGSLQTTRSGQASLQEIADDLEREDLEALLRIAESLRERGRMKKASSERLG